MGVSAFAASKNKTGAKAKSVQKTAVCNDDSQTCLTAQIKKVRALGVEKSTFQPGSFFTYKDTVKLSSGNVLADGLFGAESVFNIYYKAKIENTDVENDEILVTIMDGELEKVKDSSYQVNRFRQFVDEQRGKPKALPFGYLVNQQLWKKFEENKLKESDLADNMLLFMLAGNYHQMDTVANVSAKLGYPKFAVEVYNTGIKIMEEKGEDTSKFMAYREKMVNDYGLQNVEIAGDKWRRDIYSELVAYENKLKKIQ